MKTKVILMAVATVFATAVSTTLAQDKQEWTDASGHYTVSGDLVARDNQRVVLQKENNELISIAIKDLSKEDQAYLQEKLNEEEKNGSSDSIQTWQMANGLLVKGNIVDFGQRDFRIGRQRAKIYVNDRLLANLPEIYQKMVPAIVSHFEEQEIEDVDALNIFLRRKGRQLEYKLEGVLLELENGDRYGVPFFFFSDADRKALKPGWERWLAAKDDAEAKQKEALYLRAQTQAQADAEAQAKTQELAKMRQIAELNLQLQAYNAGLFDLWEVALSPRGGGRSMVVVVPGRDSREATRNALAKYPNGIVRGVAKARRRY